uniref:Uncharacterized protein n=1 Tax=Arundo donax TaxID=35708 RepID=A0A0A9H6U2_ARUDO
MRSLLACMLMLAVLVTYLFIIKLLDPVRSPLALVLPSCDINTDLSSASKSKVSHACSSILATKL